MKAAHDHWFSSMRISSDLGQNLQTHKHKTESCFVRLVVILMKKCFCDQFCKKRNTSLWLKLVKMIFVLIFIELIVKLQFSIYQDNWSVMGFEIFWPDLTITFGKSKSNHLQYKLVSPLWNEALVCLFWCHGKSKYKWQPWVSIIDYDVNWLM